MAFECNENTYALLSDDELALVASSNKDALLALVVRHSGLVEKKAKAMCVPPVEQEDLFQEGLIGLLDAVNAYRTDKGAGFVTFANICVKNKMLSVLSKRGKFVSLEDAENLPQSDETEESPESILLRKEQERATLEIVSKELSAAEWEVLQLYLRGFSYNRIASELKTSVKAADNAMQRVRRKLRLVLKTDDKQ